jgi:Holliday junction resolvasome RuvABC DNA-binding subunit
VHDGRLVLEGDAVSGWKAHHVDGTPYGQVRLLAAKAEAFAGAFSALVRLGFKHREARQVLGRLQSELGAHASVEAVLRAALALLADAA